MKYHSPNKGLLVCRLFKDRMQWLETVAILSTESIFDIGRDEEDRILEKKMEKLERKKFHKAQDAVIDELLPKATGREALLEKKALRREQARNREDSPEIMKERDVMGGGDDFQQRYALFIHLKLQMCLEQHLSCSWRSSCCVY